MVDVSSLHRFRRLIRPITSVISGRQVELLQKRDESRVVVQAVQQGLRFRKDQFVIMARISPVQPLERFVGLVPENVNLGD